MNILILSIIDYLINFRTVVGENFQGILVDVKIKEAVVICLIFGQDGEKNGLGIVIQIPVFCVIIDFYVQVGEDGTIFENVEVVLVDVENLSVLIMENVEITINVGLYLIKRNIRIKRGFRYNITAF